MDGWGEVELEGKRFVEMENLGHGSTIARNIYSSVSAVASGAIPRSSVITVIEPCPSPALRKGTCEYD